MSNYVDYRRIYKESTGCSIPKDENGRSYEIHHVDGNRKNNNPENLMCISIKEHYDIHKSQGDWGACSLIARRMGMSVEEISALSRAFGKTLVGPSNPFYGRKHSEETKQKLRDFATDRKVSDETKLKMSLSHKGQNAWNKGVPLSEEIKKKISDNNNTKTNAKNWLITNISTNEQWITKDRVGWCKEHGINYNSLNDAAGKRTVNGYTCIALNDRYGAELDAAGKKQGKLG